MSWIRWVLFGDPRCAGCTRVRAACICRTNPRAALRRSDPRQSAPRRKR